MTGILRNQIHADNSVMAAPRKQVTLLLRINVDYQIIYDHEARFTAGVTKILRYAIVINDICGQQLTRRNSGLVAVTPDYTAVKHSFGVDGVKFLQETYAK